MQQYPFFTYNKDFTLFGYQHLIVIVLMIFLCFALPFFAKRYLNTRQQQLLSRIMAVIISFGALFYPLARAWLGDFSYQTDLPLDICNITALMLPFLMWKPNYRVHEILYFWILAGTMQAIITPHLYNGFPNYIFIKYWIVHAGLVIYAIYVMVVFDFKPGLRSVWKAFGALQLYVIFILVINLLIGTNYVYVLGKPPTASALDYLGTWPWYLLVCELICLIMFFVVHVPIWLSGRKEKIALVAKSQSSQ